MTDKKARKSFGEDYICKKDWPEDCFVQCGDSGVVFADEPYTTAFFESFPQSPRTFLRGEGETIEEAENQAWVVFEKIKNCKEHDFIKQQDGTTGICKNCSLRLRDHFLPENKCSICGKPHVYNSIGEKENKKFFCIEHYTDEMLNPDFNLELSLDNSRKLEYLTFFKQYAVFYKKAIQLGKVDSNEVDYKIALDLEDNYFSQTNKWIGVFLENCYKLWNKTKHGDIDKPINLLSFMVLQKKFRQVFMDDSILGEDIMELSFDIIDKKEVSEERLSLCLIKSLKFIEEKNLIEEVE